MKCATIISQNFLPETFFQKLQPVGQSPTPLSFRHENLIMDGDFEIEFSSKIQF